MKFLSDILAKAGLVVDGIVTLNSVANATIDTDRFVVIDSGVVKYRTGAEILSDIGGQAALTNPVTGTGTTNYIPKFTSSSAIGNSNIYDNGTNIGIGTTSPNQRLTIGVSQTANTVMPVLKLTTTGTYSSGGSNNAGASVEFGQYHDTYPNWVLGQISAIRTGGAWGGSLVFYTNNDAAEGNKSEALRISSTGSVGIGNSNPAYALDLVVTGNNGIKTTSSAGQQLYLGNTGGEAVVGTLNNYSLGFITNGSTRMTLDASGNLGLGVTPSNALSGSVSYEIGANGTLWTETASSVFNSFNVGINFYYDISGNVKYKNTGIASSRYT